MDDDTTKSEQGDDGAENPKDPPRDEAGRFLPGHNYSQAKRPNQTEDRRRRRIFADAMLDVLNDPKASIPMKNTEGELERVPIARAVAMQTVLNAMKGNGAAIRALLTIAGGEESVDSAGDTVVIRFARGGYMDRRPTNGEWQEGDD